MSIDIKAFVAIEDAISAKLMKTWESVVLDLVKDIQVAIKSADWKKARDLAHGLDAKKVFAANRQQLKYSSYAALLFGASRLTDEPKDTIIMSKSYEPIIEANLNITKITIEKNLVDLAVKELIKIIDGIEAASVKNDVPVYKAEKRRLAQTFVSFKETGDSMLQLISSLNTSRVSAYGFTAEAEILEVEEYKVNEQLDNRICPVCREMHGKKFRVSDARSSLETILNASSPDDLKLLQPWVAQNKESITFLKSMTMEQMVAANLHIPPYHPGCRGILSHVGKVPLLRDIPISSETHDYVATEDSFTAIGVKVTQDKLDIWNSKVKLDPALILASALGKTPQELLDAVYGNTAAGSKAYGLTTMSITDKAIMMNAEGKFFGASENMLMSYKYLPDKDDFYINLVELNAVDQGKGIMKKALKSVTPLWDALEIKQVTLGANVDTGAYAWAKYGWVPKQESWDILRNNFLPKKMAILKDKLPEDVFNAVQTILNSSNPKSIWALADITTTVEGIAIGKYLLQGEFWSGVLSLDDAEALSRFTLYLG